MMLNNIIWHYSKTRTQQQYHVGTHILTYEETKAEQGYFTFQF